MCMRFCLPALAKSLTLFPEHKMEVFLDVNMGDPLSVTASVIAVTRLAYSSAKSLKEAIASSLNTPEELRDLGKDLGVLQNLLQALLQSLDGAPNANLSNDQKACFESMKPALSACKEMC